MTAYPIDEWLAHSSDKPRDEVPFFKIYNNLPVCLHNAYLAGGAVRALVEGMKPDTDWDFFFRNEEEWKRTCDELKGLGWSKTTENDFNTTFVGTVNDADVKVQLIKIVYFPTLKTVLDSFDFTICQFGYHRDILLTGKYSLWDLSRKRLAVNRITYAASSLRRMLKYASKGYFVCQGCATTLLQAVALNPNVIQSDVEYVD